MPKYNIGDIVMIRPDIEVGKRYYSDVDTESADFIDEMLRYRGERLVISDIVFGSYYEIQNDKGAFSWVDEMFVPYTDIHPIDIGSMI